MGIGGSCTNDGGMGCLQALGCVTDFKGIADMGDIFCGIHLTQLQDFLINTQAQLFKYEKLKIDIACDVNNPFIGKNGAVYTFSRQKGVKTEEELSRLENGMINLAKLIEEKTGINISNMPGAGAAGGIR